MTENLNQRYQKDVFESSNLPGDGGRRDSARRVSRSILNMSHSRLDRPWLTGSDEHRTTVSGVFEGTAGPGIDSRSSTGYTVDTPFTGDESTDGGATEAYEFFRGKSFKPINFEEGFTVNQYLGQEQRTDFAFEGGFGSDIIDTHENIELDTSNTKGTTFKATRADTMKQLETISLNRKHVLLETPVERVNRLQMEVVELMTFINAFIERRQLELKSSEQISLDNINDSATSGLHVESAIEEAKRFFGANPSVLLNELHQLKDYLNSVATSDSFATLANATIGVAPTPIQMISVEKQDNEFVNTTSITRPVTDSTIRFVADHLQSIEETLKNQDSSTDNYSVEETHYKSTSDTKPFTYELYTVPSQRDAYASGRILELEKRLADVEKALGIEKGFQFGLPFDDVSTALKDIVHRLMLLHPGRLDMIFKRFQSLGLQIDDLLHRQERVSAMLPSKQLDSHADLNVIQDGASITELYQFCESTRNSVASLPTVIRRLKALKLLHQEAGSVCSRLTTLEAQQTEFAQLLDTTQNEFEDLKQSVTKNISWVREIVNTIQQKMTE